MCVLYTIHSSVAGFAGYYTSDQADLLWNVGAALLLAWWVLNDSRKRNIHRPHELGAFIFFGWPLTVPVYLLWTRGLRGLKGVLWVALFGLSPYVAGEGVYILYGG